MPCEVRGPGAVRPKPAGQLPQPARIEARDAHRHGRDGKAAVGRRRRREQRRVELTGERTCIGDIRRVLGARAFEFADRAGKCAALGRVRCRSAARTDGSSNLV